MDILLKKEEVYHELGNLFYAITEFNDDQVIKKKTKIIEVLEKHWSGYDGGIKSTEIILASITDLSIKKSSSEEAYVSFQTCFIRNSVSFNEDLKHKIIEGAEKIAILFADVARPISAPG